MNFIGHLFVARWHNQEPAFALGSMLPDFASMARVKLGKPENEELQAGIALHHRTDDAFHHHPIFVRLMQETLTALTDRGVARGPARAVAHIGVELLIDGELVHEAGTGDAYLSALADAHLVSRDRDLEAPCRTALSRVHQRLSTYGVPYDYRNTDAVVMRLTRALSGRPRLELEQKDGQIVAKVLPEIQRRVQRALPSLLDELRGALLNEGILAQ